MFRKIVKNFGPEWGTAVIIIQMITSTMYN